MFTVKATVLKYSELSWSALTQIKAWFQRSPARNGFTLENFANNPSLKVAQAVNSVGQTIILTPIEPCYIIGAFLQDPDATSVEMRRGCDSIDVEIARLAQREGITKFLIAIPDSHPSQPGERCVRVIERVVPQIAAVQVGCHTQSATAHVN